MEVTALNNGPQVPWPSLVQRTAPAHDPLTNLSAQTHPYTKKWQAFLQN